LKHFFENHRGSGSFSAAMNISLSYTLIFEQSVKQRVFRAQQIFCTFFFRLVHLPLETLFITVTSG
jgi:hypothetical protein